MKYIKFGAIGRVILAIATTLSLHASSTVKMSYQNPTSATTQRSTRPDRPSSTSVAIPVHAQSGQFETITVNGDAKILGDLLVCGHIPKIETCLEALESCCEQNSRDISILDICCDESRSCCERLTSIIERIEDHLSILDLCCEQSQSCCEQNASCCERLTSVVEIIEDHLSILDLCCLQSQSCCASLQSQIDLLNNCCPKRFCIDFQKFTVGDTTAAINAGLIGVTLSASSTCGNGLIIFDTSNPGTGNEPLGSPNQECSLTDCPAQCPGIGSGGSPEGSCPNCTPLGKVLILSDAGTLNPCILGGTITIDFVCPVIFEELGVLNQDSPLTSPCNTIFLFDSNNNPIGQTPIPDCCANGYQVVPVNVSGVKRAEITLCTNAAITHFCFRCETVDEAARSCCENLSSRVEALETCCDRVTSIIESFETRIEEVESCCDETRRCCSAFEIVINNFISEFDSFETRIENLESCCEQNKTGIDNLVSCCDNHETRIERLESCCERVSSILDLPTCQDCCPKLFCINFDQLRHGDDQATINALLCGLVITGSGNNCVGPNPCTALIYDSSLPITTGLNAANLGTPNVANGGPGQEEGGLNTNTTPQGNVLIIGNGSGNIQADGFGGTLAFTFTCPVVIDNLGFLDGESDDQAALITLFDNNNAIITTIAIPSLGDNTFQLVPINVSAVKRLEVTYDGIAAITQLCFHCEVIDLAARSCCDFVSSVVEFQQTQIENLISCCDNHETRIESLESCCDRNTTAIDNLISCCDNHETRIEALETCCDVVSSLVDFQETQINNLISCCDEVRSRLDALECQTCCPKQICVDFSKFALGDSEEVVNAQLCGVQVFGMGVGGGSGDIHEPCTSEVAVNCSCNVPSTNRLFGINGRCGDAGNYLITFACPVVLDSIGLFHDTQNSFAAEATINTFDAQGNLLSTTEYVSTIINECQTIPINQNNVSRVEINATSGGIFALACFCYHCEVIDLAARSCCDVVGSLVDFQETQINNLISCCDLNTANINELVSCCDNHETRVENLESCCDLNTANINDLTTCCDNHETRIENLESCCAQNISCCDQLISRVDSIQNNLTNQFGQLVFTAGDLDPLGVAKVIIPIHGISVPPFGVTMIGLPNNVPASINLAFGLPDDVDLASTVPAQVDVHFFTSGANPALGGSLPLDLFVDFISNPGDESSLNGGSFTSGISVSVAVTEPMPGDIRHFVATFTLPALPTGPQSWAVLALTRPTVILPLFINNILVSSVVFRYKKVS